LDLATHATKERERGRESFDFLKSLLLELYEPLGCGVLFWCEEEGRMSFEMP
jgi:hypothetical protein